MVFDTAAGCRVIEFHFDVCCVAVSVSVEVYFVGLAETQTIKTGTSLIRTIETVKPPIKTGEPP